MESVRFSCVIDDNPLFKMQALNWLRTIIASRSARPEEIIVHLISGEDPVYRGTLDRFGITVRSIEPFGGGEAAYCNKLMQFGCSELQNAGCAVLCDTDLAMAGDIRPWINADSIRAKVVDAPNPPLDVLKSLYAATGLSAKPRIVSTSFNRGQTFETNCNGGLYIIPSQWFEKLTKAWIKWCGSPWKITAYSGRT